jgi:bacillithiol synthase
MDNSYCIDYHQTHAFSKLFLDYVDGEEKLKEFYQFAPSLTSIPNAIAKKSKENINRNLLVDRLTHQYKNIKLSKSVEKNISSLTDKNTYTITTGHQLAIYTGEWYFIFKIITAINMAKEAKELYPEYNFVPVFWMASEDHDFEEINHIHLKKETFEWKEKVSGPTGRLKVDPLTTLTESLSHFLVGKKYTEALISVFKLAYTKGNTLAEGTRILVNELFKDDGLVIIDADDSELKKSWSGVIEKELREASNFNACTLQSEKLLSLQYPTQVYPREINLFYLLDGYRERIVKENDVYQTNDGKYFFEKDTIFTELKNHPERFSPNVVLRPLYQESILPNLSYIGGPGEIAYWLQLKTMFEQNQVSYPILAWRNSFMIMDKKDKTRWNELGIEMEKVFNSVFELENEYVSKHQQEKINLAEEKIVLEQYIEAIKQKAISVDENLQFSLKGMEKRILGMMERIEHKIWKAEKRKFKTQLTQISTIKQKYFPNGKLQERYDNFSFWYATCGRDGMEILKKETKVLQKDFKILLF